MKINLKWRGGKWNFQECEQRINNNHAGRVISSLISRERFDSHDEYVRVPGLDTDSRWKLVCRHNSNVVRKSKERGLLSIMEWHYAIRSSLCNSRWNLISLLIVV